jgi:2,5-diamino-6-(ribosylamino)-4(3H)-pyrimidinone 5'-phosphate reductase
VKENLIDEAIITITPYILGGSSSPTLVDGKGFSIIKKSTKLKLKKTTKMKNEVVLYYEK